MFEKLRPLGRNLKQEIKVYRLLLVDKRTPKLAKFLLWLAIGYMLLPFDLIPDFIPIIGHLDDAIIIPALVLIAFKTISNDVVEDCRIRAKGLFSSNQ
ncbi:MAG: DUF1232 domain-containing protein [Candidatus Dadabacteria bacterium]|nr:DUF1232 domain-containing protein [Candidatus Dadabacteria bacterium]